MEKCISAFSSRELFPILFNGVNIYGGALPVLAGVVVPHPAVVGTI